MVCGGVGEEEEWSGWVSKEVGGWVEMVYRGVSR